MPRKGKTRKTYATTYGDSTLQAFNTIETTEGIKANNALAIHEALESAAQCKAYERMQENNHQQASPKAAPMLYPSERQHEAHPSDKCLHRHGTAPRTTYQQSWDVFWTRKHKEHAPSDVSECQ